MDYTQYYQSPIGEITLSSDGISLVGLWFLNQQHYGEILSGETAEKNLPIFAETREWLDCYFVGEVPSFTPKISLRGSAFRRRVWERLLTIPYGATLTYGEIAKELTPADSASTIAAQAVGNAVGHNPIAIIGPCHRVIGRDGSLKGYAGGLPRKQYLLALEKNPSLPQKFTLDITL